METGTDGKISGLSTEQIRVFAEHSVRPAYHLVEAPVDSLSRIGGMPFAPPQFAWPESDDDALDFLAQIDLADVPALPSWMPRSGQLYFFYERKQAAWGYGPADFRKWRIIYCDEPKDLLRETPPPPGTRLFNSYPVAFRGFLSQPNWQRLDFQADDFNRLPVDRMARSAQSIFAMLPRHQLFGYPLPIQSDDMELECQLAANGVHSGTPALLLEQRIAELEPGSRDWRLLLQLDTDDEAGMAWGDAGTLYFWIREEDARKADFSRVWMILQCY